MLSLTVMWLTQHANPLHMPAERSPYQYRLRNHSPTPDVTFTATNLPSKA
ncbi:hypothetical protein [Vreelandella titanicae]|nr:hypothetical protein [Halomonas titanicae]